MFFAAIYQNNQFCIITREATEKISTIHHREPLIINQSQINFIDEFNIEYGIIARGSEVSNLIKSRIIDRYEDPISGDTFVRF